MKIYIVFFHDKEASSSLFTRVKINKSAITRRITEMMSHLLITCIRLSIASGFKIFSISTPLSFLKSILMQANINDNINPHGIAKLIVIYFILLFFIKPSISSLLNSTDFIVFYISPQLLIMTF